MTQNQAYIEAMFPDAIRAANRLLRQRGMDESATRDDLSVVGSDGGAEFSFPVDGVTYKIAFKSHE